MSTFQKKLQHDRNNEETSNAGLKWDASDDEYLILNAMGGMSIEDLRKNLKRTPGSIKTRLIINALYKIENENVDRETICSQLNITEADIIQYEQKKTQRDDRRTKKPYYDNRGGNDRGNYFPPNELAEIYEALSIITKKLDNLSDKDNEILKVLKKNP